MNITRSWCPWSVPFKERLRNGAYSLRCDSSVTYLRVCLPPFKCLFTGHSPHSFRNPIDCQFTCWIPGFLHNFLSFCLGRCNCDPVGPHVTGTNDTILNEGGRTTAVALGHSFGTPPRGPAGQRQSPGLVSYDQVGLMA
jgi:hypothetical protein